MGSLLVRMDWLLSKWLHWKSQSVPLGWWLQRWWELNLETEAPRPCLHRVQGAAERWPFSSWIFTSIQTCENIPRIDIGTTSLAWQHSILSWEGVGAGGRATQGVYQAWFLMGFRFKAHRTHWVGHLWDVSSGSKVVKCELGKGVYCLTKKKK